MTSNSGLVTVIQYSRARDHVRLTKSNKETGKDLFHFRLDARALSGAAEAIEIRWNVVPRTARRCQHRPHAKFRSAVVVRAGSHIDGGDSRSVDHSKAGPHEVDEADRGHDLCDRGHDASAQRYGT